MVASWVEKNCRSLRRSIHKQNDSCGNTNNARNSLWAKYATANTMIKILRDLVPVRLHCHFYVYILYERRAPIAIKFFVSSKKESEDRHLGIRLKEIFDVINDPISLHESNCSIWPLLKKYLFKIDNVPPIIPVGVCFNGPGPLPVEWDTLWWSMRPFWILAMSNPQICVL